MRERVRLYEPQDTRGPKSRRDKSARLRDGGMVDEFAFLLTGRDQATPDLGDQNEKGAGPSSAPFDKSSKKGFER